MQSLVCHPCSKKIREMVYTCPSWISIIRYTLLLLCLSVILPVFIYLFIFFYRGPSSYWWAWLLRKQFCWLHNQKIWKKALMVIYAPYSLNNHKAKVGHWFSRLTCPPQSSQQAKNPSPPRSIIKIKQYYPEQHLLILLYKENLYCTFPFVHLCSKD